MFLLRKSVYLVFRAAQENVIAVIGPRTSTNVQATNPVCAGLQLPQLAPVATAPTLVPYEYPFLARVSYYKGNLQGYTTGLQEYFIRLQGYVNMHEANRGKFSNFWIFCSISMDRWANKSEPDF